VREPGAARVARAAPTGAVRRARDRPQRRPHRARVGGPRGMVRRAPVALAGAGQPPCRGGVARRGDRRRRADLLAAEHGAALARAGGALPVLAFERVRLIYSLVVTLISLSSSPIPLGASSSVDRQRLQRVPASLDLRNTGVLRPASSCWTRRWSSSGPSRPT